MSAESVTLDLVRRVLADEIDKGKDGLVSNPSDRAAGRVQGLMQALQVVNGTFTQVNEAPRMQKDR